MPHFQMPRVRLGGWGVVKELHQDRTSKPVSLNRISSDKMNSVIIICHLISFGNLCRLIGLRGKRNQNKTTNMASYTNSCDCAHREELEKNVTRQYCLAYGYESTGFRDCQTLTCFSTLVQQLFQNFFCFHLKKTIKKKFAGKIYPTFHPVFGSKQNCHSLPSCMIYEIYKLVEKMVKPPPLHLMYSYFHKRAWF